MKNNFLQVQRLRCKPKDQDTVTVLLKKEKNQEKILLIVVQLTNSLKLPLLPYGFLE